MESICEFYYMRVIKLENLREKNGGGFFLLVDNQKMSNGNVA